MRFPIILISLILFFGSILLLDLSSDGKVLGLVGNDSSLIRDDMRRFAVSGISIVNESSEQDDSPLDQDNDDQFGDSGSSTAQSDLDDEMDINFISPSDSIPPTKYDPEFLYHLGPGVNLASAEFAPNDPTYAHSYPIQSLDYYHSKNVRLIRLPFLWERMQPTLNAPLSQSEIEKMTQFLDKAAQLEMFVILDLHNYARYAGEVVGTGSVPRESLGDLWVRMIQVFKDHPALLAYGVMNEPHDTGGTWYEIAQETVDAIRSVDSDTLILMAGDGWSGAFSWRNNNENFIINDPFDRTVYEAHVYFDAWNIGTYNCMYDDCGITPTLVSERIDPFISWLKEKDKYGFIGEYGVPSNDTRWMNIMRDFLKKLRDNQVGSTIWAGGPYWGSYVLSVEPLLDNGQVVSEKPQMLHLERVLSGCQILRGADAEDQCVIKVNRNDLQ